MSALKDFRMYARYMLGLWSYLREPPLTWEEALAVLKRRLQEREDNFLRILERGVYGHPSSVYLKLLRHAGCEFGDLRDMVRQRGLETTLQKLYEAGVYVDFEEFKGRKPIIRNGIALSVTSDDFDNPLPQAGYYLESSGSTGASTRTPTDLGFFRDRAPHYMATHFAQETLGIPRAMWRGTLPDNAGLDAILISSRFGEIPERWFTPVAPEELQAGFKNHAAMAYTLALARLCGQRFPTPEVVRPDQAIVVARWVAAALQRHGKCLLNAPIASHMRVCMAAQEAGMDFTGAVLMGSGEPPTPAKVQVVTRTGARHAVNYWFSEGGQTGTQCRNPVQHNEVHFFADAMALIQVPRPIPGTDDMVNAFCFTSLLPSAPKLLLNVAIDDFGIVEERNCGCPLHEIGFSTHIRNIQSATKLTGEGMTLVGSDMVHILHDVLPRRFGGTPLDYQLQEEEDDDGFTRLSLVIDPGVALTDEDAVVSAVLGELKKSGAMAATAQALWASAKTMRVKRALPFTTQTGKLPPLHVSRRSG